MPFELEVKFLSELFSIAGVGFGAVLGGLGYWLKNMHERRRTTNRMLSLLLEVRHIVRSGFRIRALLSDMVVGFLGRYFESRGIVVSQENMKEVEESLSTYLVEIISPHQKVLDKDFLRKYESAIYDLSADKPFLAYRVRGLESVGPVIEKQISALERSLEGSGLDEIAFKNSVVKKVSFGLTQKHLMEIDEVIKELATASGFFVARECKKKLRSLGLDFNMRPKEAEVVAKMMDSYMARYMAQSGALQFSKDR